MKTLIKKIKEYPYTYKVIGKVELNEPFALSDVNGIESVKGDQKGVVLTDNAWSGEVHSFDILKETEKCFRLMGFLCGFNSNFEGLEQARITLKGLGDTSHLIDELEDGFIKGEDEKACCDRENEIDAMAEFEHSQQYDPQI